MVQIQKHKYNRILYKLQQTINGSKVTINYKQVHLPTNCHNFLRIDNQSHHNKTDLSKPRPRGINTIWQRLLTCMTLKMTAAQLVETSVTNNNCLSKDYPHLYDHEDIKNRYSWVQTINQIYQYKYLFNISIWWLI